MYADLGKNLTISYMWGGMMGFNPNLHSIARLGSLVIYVEGQGNWELKTER